MSRIEWPDDPNAFERGIAVLLSRMPLNVERIDGSGGDGGRDAQFTDDSGLHVFEMKSFTGRMDHQRRAQVTRSLARAAALNPSSWTLVVPIDPTPGELEWFKSLRASHPFTLTWRGATWIEARLTEHPQVRKFYFANALAESEQLLRQLVRENGPVADVGDALERMRGMCQRLAELEPHYTFRLSTGPGPDSSVEMQPAYPGAERDRPAGFWIAFADTPEAQATAQEWERAVAFGDPIEVRGEHLDDFQINGPAVLGVPQSWPSAGMTLRVAARTLPADHAAQLVVADAQGRRVAVMGLRMTSLRAGTRGSVLSGTDATGSFQCQLRMDTSTSKLRLELQISIVNRLRPAARLDVIRFAATLLPHHTLRVILGDEPLTDPSPVPVLEGLNPERANAAMELLEQLITIEHLAVTTFELPARMSLEDEDAVRTAFALLTGRTAEVNAVATSVDADDVPEIRQLVADHGIFEVTTTVEDYEVEILGQRIPVGTVSVQTPPVRVTGAVPTQTGWRLSLDTPPGLSGRPFRIIPAGLTAAGEEGSP
ncbi:hypothetical protein HRW12_35375 [Streptomyces lunaelactis]|uniref:hypothetical protein n=1 Tax=Streptomyces lunaelactis TaxID=1535768 RepID=UPI0015850761|nr:hypothetical protein [Streptomyces lunaelactis]NUK38917.1 hypothetical protein [Streptomyces lunaelactis]